MGGILSSFVGDSAAAAATPSPETSNVLSFHSSARWQLHYNSARESSQLTVIDFSAAWCGPCKLLEPAIHAMASKYTDVEFVKIDVDELADVAQEFQVQAMPTIVLLKRGVEVDRVVGVKKDEIELKVKKHK